jgi:predicted MPP superfamily phosphohydrolase
MKKWVLISLLVVLTLALSACTPSAVESVYTDDTPFVLEMKNETLKILQVTDLHLTYGIDANDRKTLRTIERLNDSDEFDLIVISGDLFMSPSAPRLFRQLIRHMESLKTPWTFVFGNHETDFQDYLAILNQIPETEYLYFKVGPELEDGGYGNFRIVFTKDDVPFYNAYFLDSHAEREVYTEEEGTYDFLKPAQVTWYESHVQNDTVDSVVYMHMPLRQFIDPETYIGIFNEDKVYAQGVDTGFYDAMVRHGRSKGVFVGHDHLNDFALTMDGIILAYGRITGHNAYGNLERGGRVVFVDASQAMTTYVLRESEAIE